MNKEIRNCFCCGKKIIKLSHNIGKCIHPEHDMWDGGIVDILGAGYGSKFDSNVYIIAICDECIEKNVERLDFRFKSV